MDPFKRDMQKHREMKAAQKKAKKDKVERVKAVHQSNQGKGNMANTNLTGWTLNDTEELVRS